MVGSGYSTYVPFDLEFQSASKRGILRANHPTASRFLLESTQEANPGSSPSPNSARDLIRVPGDRPDGGPTIVSSDDALTLFPSFPTDGGYAPADQPRDGDVVPPSNPVTRIRRQRRPAWRPVFLGNLRTTGNASHAAAVAGIDRSTAYAAATRDAAFKAAWQMAAEEAVDGLEAEARRRAMNGSDQLLMFLLRGLRPERYRRETPDVRREIQREVERVAALQGIPVAEVLEDVERRARELDQ